MSMSAARVGTREGEALVTSRTSSWKALANLHSGLAQITVQEWAVLLRCKAFRPVEADELVKSLIDWFGAPLSAGEISEFISRMVTEGFLARFDGGELFQTTALGHDVLEQSQRPIMRAALWMFQNKDEEEVQGMSIGKLVVSLGMSVLIGGAALAQGADAPADAVSSAGVGVSEAGRPAAGDDVTGDEFYCRERKLGTWFYRDRAKRPPVADKARPAPPMMTATAQLAEVTQRLDELKARAVLEPSEENVTAYIRYQREQLDRASTFSDVWQRTMWQNPDLDYTLQRPVSTLGKRAWLDNRKDEQERVLRQLSQRYGIFYFYAQSCGACEVFAPILKSLV